MSKPPANYTYTPDRGHRTCHAAKTAASRCGHGLDLDFGELYSYSCDFRETIFTGCQRGGSSLLEGSYWWRLLLLVVITRATGPDLRNIRNVHFDRLSTLTVQLFNAS